MPGIDTSRIANEKQRRFAQRLSSVEERVENISAEMRDYIRRLEAVEHRLSINIEENRADLPGYDNEEETIHMLREQLDQLGVPYHRANKEKKLRELLNEALMGKGEKDAETQ